MRISPPLEGTAATARAEGKRLKTAFDSTNDTANGIGVGSPDLPNGPPALI
jgi:hypothetical protein